MIHRTAWLESPFAGNVERNITYARDVVLWGVRQGYAVLCSHLIYPQVLDDDEPDERQTGIEAGLRWQRNAEQLWVATDHGISAGMARGLRNWADVRPFGFVYEVTRDDASGGFFREIADVSELIGRSASE